MTKVYAIADNIFSPLGYTTSETIHKMGRNESGIRFHEKKYANLPSFYSALIKDSDVENQFSTFANSQLFTKLEKMAILSIKDALSKCNVDAASNKTLFIISTTKGNIDLLQNPQNFTRERTYLTALANVISKYFKNSNTAIVVSNACISGVLAIITAKKCIENGDYDTVIVCGCDLASEFVLAGFFSFQAISHRPCRPFDITRDGITIGESCGTLILSKNLSEGKNSENILINEGATSNDANHISGPSRTGDGLHIAISKALKVSEISAEMVNYISVHGTGTIYNDEMETKALALSKLLHKPINSLKGYFGHTLGAAGVIESIVSIKSMQANTVFASLGFETLGVSSDINIVTQPTSVNIQNCLKLASGFGGCNAALIFSKQ